MELGVLHQLSPVGRPVRNGATVLSTSSYFEGLHRNPGDTEETCFYFKNWTKVGKPQYFNVSIYYHMCDYIVCIFLKGLLPPLWQEWFLPQVRTQEGPRMSTILVQWLCEPATAAVHAGVPQIPRQRRSEAGHIPGLWVSAFPQQSSHSFDRRAHSGRNKWKKFYYFEFISSIANVKD